MIRKTLTILSFIGLLLSAGLWGVSYWEFTFAPDSLNRRFSLARGAFHYSHITGPISYEEARRSINPSDPPGQQSGGSARSNGQLLYEYHMFKPGMGFVGFQSFDTWWLPSSVQSTNGSFTIYHGRAPIWPLTVGCATLGLWIGRPLHRHRKRKKLGLCLKCGYDLRGSQERCPECGQEFETT